MSVEEILTFYFRESSTLIFYSETANNFISYPGTCSYIFAINAAISSGVISLCGSEKSIGAASSAFV